MGGRLNLDGGTLNLEWGRSSSMGDASPPSPLQFNTALIYHTRWRLHIVPLIAELQAGKLLMPIFIVFGLTRPGIEPESTASVADALFTRRGAETRGEYIPPII